MTSWTSPRRREHAAVGRVGEEVAEDLLGALELVDGLEQRHEPDPGDGCLCGARRRPARPRAPAPPRRGRRRRPGSSTRCSSPRCAARARRAPSGWCRRSRRWRPPSSSSGNGWRDSGRRPASSRESTSRRAFGSSSAYGTSRSPTPVEQLAHGVVVLLGVLAHVQRGEREPGRGDGAHQTLEVAAGDQRALVLEHRPVQQRAGRRAARCRRGSRGRAGAAHRGAIRCSVSRSRTWTQVRNSR